MGVVHGGAPAVVDLQHLEGPVAPLDVVRLRRAIFGIGLGVFLEIIRISVLGLAGQHVIVKAGRGDEHVSDHGKALGMVGRKEVGSGVAFVRQGKLPSKVEL